MRAFEVRSGTFGVDWGPVWGPKGPKLATNATPNDPDRTSDILKLQPHELQPHPKIADKAFCNKPSLPIQQPNVSELWPVKHIMVFIMPTSPGRDSRWPLEALGGLPGAPGGPPALNES